MTEKTIPFRIARNVMGYGDEDADKLPDVLDAYLRELPERIGDMDFCLESAGLLACVGKALWRGKKRKRVLEKCAEFETAFAALFESESFNPSLRELYVANGFSPLELEVLLILAGGALGVSPSISDVEDLQNCYPEIGPSRIELARLFLPDGRLIANGMVTLAVQRPFKDSRPKVSDNITGPILQARGKLRPAKWDVECQEDLLQKLHSVRAALLESGSSLASRSTDEDEYYPERDERDRLVGMFIRSIDPEWRLQRIIDEKFTDAELRIVLTLLSVAALGRKNPTRRSHFGNSTDLYSGEGLAHAAADEIDECNAIIRRCLMPGCRLLDGNFIRAVSDAAGNMQRVDEDSVREMHFELTDDYLDLLGVKRRKRSHENARAPLMSLDRLALPDSVREAVELAANQYRCRDVLDKWDLSASIPYGRAMTILFSGPPGVGKTATAEAIADLLEKRIIVADYSQLQSCWVGETEKNIVRLFRAAAESDAVLFWDEADAMFYDRDTATRNFEVRDVNVLLQSLESFGGVCILSTNRKISLDKALARRISLKIDFPVPDAATVRAIWRKILPPKMPLADDVDVDRLARTQLTGGEIKNVVLNAARRAAGRGAEAAVTMADFLWALETESAGKDFSGMAGRRVGFAAACAKHGADSRRLTAN